MKIKIQVNFYFNFLKCTGREGLKMNSSKFLQGLFRNYKLFIVVKNFDKFNKFRGLKCRFEFDLNLVDANGI